MTIYNRSPLATSTTNRRLSRSKRLHSPGIPPELHALRYFEQEGVFRGRGEDPAFVYRTAQVADGVVVVLFLVEAGGEVDFVADLALVVGEVIFVDTVDCAQDDVGVGRVEIGVDAVGGAMGAVGEGGARQRSVAVFVHFPAGVPVGVRATVTPCRVASRNRTFPCGFSEFVEERDMVQRLRLARESDILLPGDFVHALVILHLVHLIVGTLVFPRKSLLQLVLLPLAVGGRDIKLKSRIRISRPYEAPSAFWGSRTEGSSDTVSAVIGLVARFLACRAALGLRIAAVGGSVAPVAAFPAADFGQHEASDGIAVLALVLEVVVPVADRAVFLAASVLGYDVFEDVAFGWEAIQLVRPLAVSVGMDVTIGVAWIVWISPAVFCGVTRPAAEGAARSDLVALIVLVIVSIAVGLIALLTTIVSLRCRRLGLFILWVLCRSTTISFMSSLPTLETGWTVTAVTGRKAVLTVDVHRLAIAAILRAALIVVSAAIILRAALAVVATAIAISIFVLWTRHFVECLLE